MFMPVKFAEPASALVIITLVTSKFPPVMFSNQPLLLPEALPSDHVGGVHSRHLVLMIYDQDNNEIDHD